MATYEHTKELVSARPTVRNSDGFVKNWEIEAEYSYAGDEANDLPAWSNTYSHSWDVEEPSKAPAGYTKAELIAEMPAVISDHIFHAHYEAFNLPAVQEEETVSDFDVNSLS